MTATLTIGELTLERMPDGGCKVTTRTGWALLTREDCDRLAWWLEPQRAAWLVERSR